jgi:translation initiation factor 4G
MIEIPLKSKLNIQFSTEEQIQRTEAAESIRNIRILLNKLAGENFARVSDTIQNNFLYTEEVTEKLAKMLFNKCIKEPKYIHLYIKLADQLFKKFSVSKLGDTGRVTGSNFRRMFLNLCQEAFESRHSNNFLNELPSDLSEEEKMFRKKQHVIGSMKLIGELFAHGILTDAVLIQCMENMQREKNEQNVEIMVNLLLTTGKKVYEYFAFEARMSTLVKKPRLKISKLDKELFDSYIDYLIAIKQNGKISARVKFLIQDIIDIRNKEWMQAFDKFPLKKSTSKKEVVFRKKTKSVEVLLPSEEQVDEKKNLNEYNVFGRSLEKYYKTQFNEKLRVFVCIND